MAAIRHQLTANGTQLAFVHMGNLQQGAEMLARYGLTEAHQFSDPKQELYRAFDLKRATLSQVFGAKVWLRGWDAFTKGHGVGAPIGDPFQMPGVFLLDNGEIVREFRHQSAADQPDYEQLIGAAA